MLYTFIVRIQSRPDVIDRVASLFRRRGFTIESLAFGPTEQAGVSQMTIVTEADERGARRVESSLWSLVNVLGVDNATGAPVVSRGLAMIKVAADAESRPRVVHLARAFRALVVDVTPYSLVIEAAGTEDTIDSLLAGLRPYGVIEVARTGRLAMRRGDQMTGAAAEPVFAMEPMRYQHTGYARSA